MSDHDPISEKIIGCAFKVANELGPGFLEKVYDNALAIELERAGLRMERKKEVLVRYQGFEVGTFAPDFIIESRFLIELKAVKALEDAHLAQALNYLRATSFPVCLLINFGSPRIEVRRLLPSKAWATFSSEPRS